jgi:uncharacterized membrane protein
MERWVAGAIWASAAILAAGLGLWAVDADGAEIAMNAGLWLLIATPIARGWGALAGYARERDWTFVALTVVVLACLFFPIVRFLLSFQR